MKAREPISEQPLTFPLLVSQKVCCYEVLSCSLPPLLWLVLASRVLQCWGGRTVEYTVSRRRASGGRHQRRVSQWHHRHGDLQLRRVGIDRIESAPDGVRRHLHIAFTVALLPVNVCTVHCRHWRQKALQLVVHCSTTQCNRPSDVSERVNLERKQLYCVVEQSSAQTVPPDSDSSGNCQHRVCLFAWSSLFFTFPPPSLCLSI